MQNDIQKDGVRVEDQAQPNRGGPEASTARWESGLVDHFTTRCPCLMREVSQFCDTVIDGIVTCLGVYGLELRSDLERIVTTSRRHWLYCIFMHGCTQDNWNAECMKFAKYKLSAFFAWGTQSEPLPNPYSGDVPSVLLGGYVNRWLHGLYSKADVTQPIPDYDTRHWVGLLHSVKQVKRMAPRPDSHTVNLSLQSTFDRLTTPDEVDMFVDDPLYGCCPATFDPDAYGAQDWPWATPEDIRLYRSFAYFVHCQVSGLDLSDEEIFHSSHVPSPSADYYQSRSRFGAIGDYLELAEDFGDDEAMDNHPVPHASPVLHYDFDN